MNKKQLIEETAKETRRSKAECERLLNAILDVIQRGLKRDTIVQLIGFGSFNVRKRKSRRGRNPHTGEGIRIRASKTVLFRAGKALKAKLTSGAS
jgi:DNA-binding protein HU-beta